MKNVLGPFIFSLFLLFGLNIDSAYAQKHNNTISGHVFSNERRAVPDIYVELKNETNATIARVKTDGSGGYFFPGL